MSTRFYAMQKFDFDKLEKNSCGNHNFLWLFAVVAVFLTDVIICSRSPYEVLTRVFNLLLENSYVELIRVFFVG